MLLSSTSSGHTKDAVPHKETASSLNPVLPVRPYEKALLNFGFLEDDVLARHRVVFTELEFFCRVTWVLFGHVVVACIGCADQSDEDGILLCHL